ncbi:MAG: ATP-binding protein [Pseudomonadota bacterium]
MLILQIIYDEHTHQPIDWLCLDCNANIENTLGFKPADIRGKRLLQVFPGLEGGPAYTGLMQTARSGESVRNVRFFPLLQKYMDAATYRLPHDRMLAVFHDVTDTIQTTDAQEHSHEQLNSLLALSSLQEDDIARRIRLLVEHSARALDVERTVVWLLNEAQDVLTCETVYTLSEGIHKSGQRFTAHDAPEYFEYLKTGRPFLVSNVQKDTRTAAFFEMLWQSAEVSAIMDIPIRIHGHVVGVLCHEHVEEERHWQLNEQEYATSIANHIAMALIRKEQQVIEKALTQSEERLIRAVESSGEFMWEWDLTSEVIHWLSIQPTSSAQSPYNKKAIWRDSSSSAFFSLVYPDDHEPLQQRIAEHIEGVTDFYETEIRTRLPDSDEYHWYLIRGKVHFDEEHNAVRLIGTSRDISQSKESALERERLISELEIKNAELERFNYTVSHDLKSPLITIRSFAGFLEQDMHREDKTRLQKDIEYIASAADTMYELLDDLLELSRAGKLVHPFEEVDMGQLLQDALLLVQGTVNLYKAEISISSDLPTIYGDRKRLLEVWQNLIENALKFSKPQTTPQIHIGCRQETPPVFYIRDNGIGIDSRYHEKVFELFERLSPEDSDGTGIGLALVRRIVEIHNGRLWVESDGMGKGSTFCFSLAVSP